MAEDKVVKKRNQPQFTDAEVDVLIDIVAKHKGVIEDKRTDSDAWKRKNSTWEKVKEEFNSRSPVVGVFRPTDNLKNKYEGLKKIVKKKQGQMRQELFATGGGSADTKLKPLEEKIANLLAPAVSGLESEFDPDNIEETPDISSHFLRNISSPTLMFVDESPPNDAVSTADWSQYSVSMLRTPVTPILQTNSSVRKSTARSTPVTENISSIDLREPATQSSTSTVTGRNSDPVFQERITAENSSSDLATPLRPRGITLNDNKRKRNEREKAASNIIAYTEQRQETVALQTRLLEEEHRAKMRVLALKEERLKKDEERQEKKFELEMKILQADLAIKNKMLSSS